MVNLIVKQERAGAIEPFYRQQTNSCCSSAVGRSRTDTKLPSRVFVTRASTNSATTASQQEYTYAIDFRHTRQRAQATQAEQTVMQQLQSAEA